jgi:hypothetical protein
LLLFWLTTTITLNPLPPAQTFAAATVIANMENSLAGNRMLR